MESRKGGRRLHDPNPPHAGRYDDGAAFRDGGGGFVSNEAGRAVAVAVVPFREVGCAGARSGRPCVRRAGGDAMPLHGGSQAAATRLPGPFSRRDPGAVSGPAPHRRSGTRARRFRRAPERCAREAVPAPNGHAPGPPCRAPQREPDPAPSPATGRGGEFRNRREYQRVGVPRGNRTPVAAVKGRCPGPLDDGDEVGTRAPRAG